MLQATIENLKGRPKAERVAFAGTTAVVVVILLFLAWVVFFISNLHATPIAESTLPDAQSASAAAAAAQDFQEATQAPAPNPSSDAEFGDQSAAEGGAQVQMSSTPTDSTTGSATGSATATSSDQASQ